jgi:hypothetical protein
VRAQAEKLSQDRQTFAPLTLLARTSPVRALLSEVEEAGEAGEVEPEERLAEPPTPPPPPQEARNKVIRTKVFLISI